jgi:hypothetical protein
MVSEMNSKKTMRQSKNDLLNVSEFRKVNWDDRMGGRQVPAGLFVGVTRLQGSHSEGQNCSLGQGLVLGYTAHDFLFAT